MPFDFGENKLEELKLDEKNNLLKEAREVSTTVTNRIADLLDISKGLANFTDALVNLVDEPEPNGGKENAA
jgi:hypothetical protein